MTYGAFTARDVAAFDRGRRSSTPLSQAALCAFALISSASAGLWALYALPPLAVSQSISTPAPHVMSAFSSAAATTPQVALALAPALAPLRRYAALLDPALTSGSTPVTFAQSAPLRARFEPPHVDTAAALIGTSDLEAEAPRTDTLETADATIVPPLPAVSAVVREEAIPVPMPRPALLASTQIAPSSIASARRASRAQAVAALAPAPAALPGRPGFFERFFGGSAQMPSPALAYATPDDGGLRGSLFAPRPSTPDNQTAVYDISSHTVYLPNGTQLEAHSGLGASKDDPRSVAERMRGATPPHIYDLTLREAPFHGVRALRLTPVGDGTTYGRGGLLAHTFMLGPRGDSNGCVVFRNYKAFIDAYDAGQIRRLLVVTHVG